MRWLINFLIPHFNPKIYELKRHYSLRTFTHDLGAGITVAIVALPLAMAFAIASGLPPESGIFTAIIAGFLISLFSGSRVQIGGPAGAFIVIVYGIIQTHGVEGLLIATFLSGIILWLMGSMRMGVLIQFIPIAVIIGFTNGIAVLIGLSQIKDFLGLDIKELPADFFPMLKTIYHALPTLNPDALGSALFALFILIIWQRFMQKHSKIPKQTGILPRVSGSLALIPGSIIALILTTLLVQILHLNTATIGSRFGGIPQSLPQLTPLNLSLDKITTLIAPAFTLALLGAIESLLCARVADSMIKDKHDSNQELFSQGFANMVVPFFSGMPATGTIARTITNIKNGGKTPIAGMIHALCLLFIVLIAAPLAQYIPLSALSAILLFVAWNMGEWREFLRLKTFRLPYRLTLLSVFILTVTVDLTVAIQVGLLLACLIFIFRISSLSTDEPLTSPPPQYRAYKLTGALFFGAVKILEKLEKNPEKQGLILDLSGIIYIDSSGAEHLKNLIESYQEQHCPLLLCGLRPQPLDILKRCKIFELLGENAIYQDYAQIQTQHLCNKERI